MKFKLIDRGYQEWMLMLPGWSFMPGIFSRIDIDANYILPSAPLVSSINQDICRIIDRLNIEKIHIIGWSLGATAAALFTSAFPHLTASVCLISVMRPFGKDEAEKMMKEIREIGEKALRRFHRLCFTGQSDDYRWFRKELQEDAINAWNAEMLERGLEFIVDNPFEPSNIQGVPAIYFHGKRDMVSPLETAPPRNLENFIVIRSAGHLPFLTEEFRLKHEQFHKKGLNCIIQQGSGNL